MSKRFDARVIDTHTCGPRLVITDYAPTGAYCVKAERYLDLPVQCRLSVDSVFVFSVHADDSQSYKATADEIDELVARLRKLQVNRLWTKRTVPLIPRDQP